MPSLQHFQISDKCSPAQRNLFTAINEALDVLGVSADEFDTRFRIRLMQTCITIAQSLNEGVVAAAPVQGKQAIEHLTSQRALAASFDAGEALNVKFPTGLTPLAIDELLKLQQAAKAMEPEIASDIAKGLMQNINLGRFQDIDIATSHPTEAELKIYKDFSRLVELPVKPQSQGTTNLLQTFASGSPFLSTRERAILYDKIGDQSIEVTSSGFAKYVLRAFLASLYSAANEKPVSQTHAKTLDSLNARILESIQQLADPAAPPPAKPSKAPPSSILNRPFEIPASLPEPEQRLYRAINRVLTLSRHSAADFDSTAKIRMAAILYNSAVFSGLSLRNQIQKDYPGAALQNDGIYARSAPEDLAKFGTLSTRVTPKGEVQETEVIQQFNSHQAGKDDWHSRAFDALIESAQTAGFKEVLNLRAPTEPFGALTVTHSHPQALGHIEELLQAISPPKSLGTFDFKRPLLGAFMSGKQKLSELDNRPVEIDWHNYHVVFGSPQELLKIALVEAAYQQILLNKQDPKASPYAEALDELESAYDYVINTPRRKLAKQEADAHNAEAKLLTAEPYSTAEATKVLSFRDRVTRSDPPQIELRDAWDQIRDLPTLLNKNFPLHQQLGDALLKGKDNPVLSTLDHICVADRSLPNGEKPAAATRKLVVDALCESLDNLTPEFKMSGLREQLIESNRTRHQEVIQAITRSPLLVIAALGTRQMIQEARNAQASLFPQKKNAAPDVDTATLSRNIFSVIAGEALEHAFREENHAVPNDIQEAITHLKSAENPLPEWMMKWIASKAPKPKPPKDDPPLPTGSASTKSKNDAPPPPTGSAGAASPPLSEDLTSLVAATATAAAIAGAATDTNKTPDSLPPAGSSGAESPQTTSQSENSAGAVATTSSNETSDSPPPPPPKNDPPSVSTTEDDKAWEAVRPRAESWVKAQLQETPPYNLFRCKLAGSEPNCAIDMHLSRWRDTGTGGSRRVEERSITIPLKGEPILAALAIKERLQNHVTRMNGVEEYARLHVQHFAIGSSDLLPDADPYPITEDGKPGKVVIKDGIRYLRLTFPPNGYAWDTVVDIPLGIRQKGDDGETAKRCDMVLDLLTQARSISPRQRLTIDDIKMTLRAQINRNQGEWQSVETINLDDHVGDIRRNVIVNFPKKGEEQTRLHVGSPKLERNPNASWIIPITISAINKGGHKGENKRIAETNINTHVGDADMALERINEITSHLRERLEDHGNLYPSAGWYMPAGRLGQFKVEDLSTNHAVDWTRLDDMTSALGYTLNFTARVQEPYETRDGRTYFTLNIQRDDNSLFLEALNTPARRIFSISALGDDTQTRAAINQFCSDVQSVFSRTLADAYNPNATPPASTVPAGRATAREISRRSVASYNSQSIVKMLDAACADALKGQPEIVELPREKIHTVTAFANGTSKDSGHGH